ncbi:hypothetical protein ET475_06305 [Microbacterium protaetiae]|uniref:Bacterial bifunctional deaminase-reductase C-terminal domain-containing protein n=1 Tax=Microbacterium protaetiae TaxID=2509458 RepID=A0A4P6EBQ8_9MICO|nr:dihydrofolate reductase family protein [Microbacterium protaetiae]QAY59640.1 hypothetical protein ET475_06305 [Microbacterium protaetiae]
MSVADEIERLRTEPGDGEIAIGGATLAAQAVEADLIDEYRMTFHPVAVGGGIPYFAQGRDRLDLVHLATRTFASGIVSVRNGVEQERRYQR